MMDKLFRSDRRLCDPDGGTSGAMRARGLKDTSSRPPKDLGGTLRHTIRTVLRSYDSRASGDLLCSHRQGAWQMRRKLRFINRERLQLPVQNQIPCAGSFGCQRIHVALNKHDDKLDRLEEICFMEKLITRKEAAEILGISIATLDAARNNGLISYVQYVQNGCVYFTSAGLQEYIAKCTHRAKPAEKNATYRKPRRAGV